MTSASLRQVIEDPKVLVPDNVAGLPVAFEVVHMIDLAGRFRGSKTFVEEVEKAFPEFWSKAGQCLMRWVPKPPKLKEPKPESVDEESPVRGDLGGMEIPVLSSGAAAAGPDPVPSTPKAEAANGGDGGET